MAIDWMRKNKKWQTKYRTATTTYPCYLPVLGDSAGAGRTDLPLQSYELNCNSELNILLISD